MVHLIVSDDEIIQVQSIFDSFNKIIDKQGSEINELNRRYKTKSDTMLELINIIIIDKFDFWYDLSHFWCFISLRINCISTLKALIALLRCTLKAQKLFIKTDESMQLIFF